MKDMAASFTFELADLRRSDWIEDVETIAEDFNGVAARLGLDARLEHRNPSARAGYREVYTPAMREIVADVYAQDIECFGYEFDGIKRRVKIADGTWAASG